MKPQSHWQSILETIFNYVVGFALAWLINRYVLRWMGYPISKSETTGITAIFTLVSVIRSYLTRRLFNWIHSRQADNSPS